MHIQDRLNVLDPISYAKEALGLFEKARAEVSWGGYHVIVVDGYEGSIDFHSLIKEFFVPKIRSEIFRSSIHNRLDGINLIHRIVGLFRTSQLKMQSSWFVKYLEEGAYTEEACSLLEDLELFLRDFSESEYSHHFGPDQPESRISNISEGKTEEDRCIASVKQCYDLFAKVSQGV